MDLPEARELLGVDAGTDAKSIKRAYLRAVKRHKPERDPEGFQRVREAYQLCRSFAVTVAPSEAVPSSVARDVHAQPAGDEASKPSAAAPIVPEPDAAGGPTPASPADVELRDAQPVAFAPTAPEPGSLGDEPEGEPAPAFEHSGDGAPRALVDVPAPEPPDPEREAERQRTFLIWSSGSRFSRAWSVWGRFGKRWKRIRTIWRSGSGSSTSYSRSGASTRPSG